MTGITYFRHESAVTPAAYPSLGLSTGHHGTGETAGRNR
jgi:hypothetical protein